VWKSEFHCSRRVTVEDSEDSEVGHFLRHSVIAWKVEVRFPPVYLCWLWGGTARKSKTYWYL